MRVVPRVVGNWVEVLRTANLDPDAAMDPVSRWLIVTRACVFSLTLLSALVGALLAALAGAFDVHVFALVVAGLLLAHAANNMVNDYFDVLHGVDSEDYPRAQYAPHPILSNLVTRRALFLAILVCNVLDLGVALALTSLRGWPIMAFACAGLAASVAYVAPPFKLKHRGLGEVAIFAIWGPLMIGGAYFALVGDLPWGVVLASVPYGLAIMAVVVGKHLDKREKDAERRVGTLPVLLGDRGGRVLMGVLVWAFYAGSAALVAAGSLPLLSLLVFASLPRAVRLSRTLSLPMPATAEEAYRLAYDQVPRDLRERFDPTKPGARTPLWPLWYVVWGVWWVRHAGLLFVAGLGAALLVPLLRGGAGEP